MATKQRNRVLLALNALLTVAMLGSGAYAAVLSVAGVENEISVGAVNIELDHYYVKEGAEAQAVYENEEISGVTEISTIPRITNKGIASYVRLMVQYFDAQGNPAERATVKDLGADWAQIGDYYYLTREAAVGEVLDTFSGIIVPDSWNDDGNTQVIMAFKADAIQAEHFEPDFASEAPWGAIAIEDFDDQNYQIDSEEKASAVTISYDDDARRCVKVPDNFLARLNLLVPGDSMSSEIEVFNNDDIEREIFVGVDATNSGLGEALRLTLVKDGVVIYEGTLAGLAEVSLGKYARGDTAKLTVNLSLPVETGNATGGTRGVLNWNFRVESEEEPVPAPPRTEDNIVTAIIIFLASLLGLMVVGLFDKHDKKETE